jgi:ubiquinone/menaquinone biosynthesis C-methylase UbiE
MLAATGQSILDVGCGIGPYVKHLNDAGRHCVGIDTNAQAIADGCAMGRPLQVGSAYELPYEDDAFDSVVLIETLEHLDDYESALREAFRVARSTVALTVPDIGVLPLMSKRAVVPWHLLEATHINFFTPAIMKNVLMRYAESCEVTTLAPFFEVDGEPLHMHIAAVASLAASPPPVKPSGVRGLLQRRRRR